MSDFNGAEALQPINPLPPADSQEALSAESAVDLLEKLRKGEQEQPAESADHSATAATESTSQEGDAAQPEKAATSETQEDAPAEKPSRELPRSWSKDKADVWAKLDPEAQEILLEQDSKASAEVRRAQNEAAEARKAIEADKKAVEVERERYLKAASSDLEAKEAAIARNFPHIKTMDDVNFLAAEALRLANSEIPDDQSASAKVQAYIQAWRVAQDDLAVTRANKAEAERKQTTERETQWTQFVREESEAFAKSVAEQDRPKLKEWIEAAPTFLVEKGFSQAELADLASGKEKLAIHDRRVQSLILDGLKYQALQKAPPKAVPKELPPVQRPGARQPAGAAASQNVQALSNRLNQTGDLDDAFALFQARRQAS
jgi:hypothetical protein